MTKLFDLDREDRQLFRQSVGPVKRLRHDQVEPARGNGPAPVPYSTLSDERQVLKDMVSNYFEPADMETGEEIQYCREGMQHTVLRKLKRGHFRVGAVLDLHGMTVAMAGQAMVAFIDASQRNNMSCVRIIHGKGNRSRHKGPVLKQKVSHWLRQRDEVLAFCSARPVDGGTGAVYVLLRRRR
jgi:DNA-nicking Smr family endonuclease